MGRIFLLDKYMNGDVFSSSSFTPYPLLTKVTTPCGCKSAIITDVAVYKESSVGVKTGNELNSIHKVAQFFREREQTAFPLFGILR